MILKKMSIISEIEREKENMLARKSGKTWDSGTKGTDYETLKGKNDTFKADAPKPVRAKVTAFDILSNYGLKYGWQPCKHCGAQGYNLRYPHYATVMPELARVPCEHCKGAGQVYVVPDWAVILRESDYK